MAKKKFSSESESESEYSDSETELQNALASGKLKPGLNTVEERIIRTSANDVDEMKRILKVIKLDLPWIESLDMINQQAPLAPEMAAQLHEQESRRANQLRNNAKLPQYAPSEDPILNDFKREMIFHRQAQAAVLEGIPKLKELGVITKRPDDFFAEMAKTDEHMQKVRQALMKRQAEMQQRERVRQLRIQKKEGKTMQVQAKLKRQEQKKEMLDQVKKVRKGLSNNLDFNEGNKKVNKKQISKKAAEKMKFKNNKYGFGGKKKGLKRNTKSSSADISDYKSDRPKKTVGKGKFGQAKKGKFGQAKKGKFGQAKNSRPGKNKRMKNKNKN